MHVPSSLGNLAAYSQFLFKEPTCERSCCRMSPCGAHSVGFQFRNKILLMVMVCIGLLKAIGKLMCHIM